MTISIEPSCLIHLDSSVQVIAQQDDLTRARHILKDIFIYHPRALRIQQFLTTLMRSPERYRPTGIYISGASGSGKTAQLRAFERAYPTFDAPDGGRRLPVVYVEMHEEPKPRTMYRELLYAAGVPWNTFPRDMPGHERVRLAFRELGVRLLFIDEVHNMCEEACSEQRRARQKVMEKWLRMLANRLRIPIVLAGTDEFAGVLENVQLASRFPFVIEIHPWTDSDEFQLFLGAWQRALPLRAPSNLIAPDMRRAILHESAGITDLIAKCLTGAALAAIRLRRESITKDLLSWWRDPPWNGAASNDVSEVARAWLEDDRSKPQPLQLFQLPGMRDLHALVTAQKRK